MLTNFNAMALWPWPSKSSFKKMNNRRYISTGGNEYIISDINQFQVRGQMRKTKKIKLR